MEEPEFISRLYDLKLLPLADYRFSDCEISTESGPAPVLKVSERSEGSDKSGFERREYFREVVAGSPDHIG